MKIIEANIYVLRIPFKVSFGHFLKIRFYSDSIIVKLLTDNGIYGYGEGIARSYVTGETVKKSIKHIKDVLVPSILNKNLNEIDIKQNPSSMLSCINNYIPHVNSHGIIAWNASRSAVELALIDSILKEQNKSLNCILPAKTKIVTYSGILTSADIKKTIVLAKQIKKNGLKYIKMKVEENRDYDRVAIVRDILGPLVSIRLDANGAFSVKNAIKFINAVERYNIDSIEQPIKRGDVKDLAFLKSNSSIPVMADESMVTLDDAKKLIDYNACDYFNLRISKCGGLSNTLDIYDLSKKAGIKIQLGCHVGETAILSASGRHLAAHLTDVEFVEGSYSTLLLMEDIAQENILFNNSGEAPVFTANGLGITIKDELLLKYAKESHLCRS